MEVRLESRQRVQKSEYREQVLKVRPRGLKLISRDLLPTVVFLVLASAWQSELLLGRERTEPAGLSTSQIHYQTFIPSYEAWLCELLSGMRFNVAKCKSNFKRIKVYIILKHT